VSKERRHWKTEDKVKALRKHLIEKVTVTKICDEMDLAPSQYHRWQEQLFLNAQLALEGKRAERTQDQKKVEKLEQKIRQKDEVLAELMAEHLALKKELGEL
jgi:transposase-like protein